MVFISKIFLFIKVYVYLNKQLFSLKVIKDLDFKRLIEFLSASRFFKFLKIYILCIKINFEFDLGRKQILLEKFFKALDFISLPQPNDIGNLSVNWCFEISGWLDHKYEFNIDNKYLNKVSIKDGLLRRDVGRSQGSKNLFSGFRIIFDSLHISRDSFRISSKVRPVESGYLHSANIVIDDILKINNLQFSEKSNLAGFIDNILIYPDLAECHENLNFNFFENIIQKFPDFKNMLKFINHPVLNALYADFFRNHPEFIKTFPLNTSIAKTLQNEASNINKIEFFEYRVQNSISPQMFNLKNARLLKGKYVVDQEGFLINEFSDSLNSDMVAGVKDDLFHDSENEGITGILTSPEYFISLKNGVVLPSLINSNWFHFITESLASLNWFKDKIPKDIPIIVDVSIPRNMIQFLKILGFNDITFVDSAREIRFDNLITFSKSAIIPDSIHKNINSLQINQELILKLRNTILDLVADNQVKSNLTDLFVFRRRGSNRSWAITKRDLKIISKFGFESVFIGEYNVVDQINLSRKASKLIIEGGAALANLIFLHSSTRIVYLTNKKLTNYVLPHYFASILGFQVILFPGKIKLINVLKADNVYEIFHSSYYFSSYRIRKLLKIFEN